MLKQDDLELESMANQSFFFIWGPAWHVRAPHVTFFYMDYRLPIIPKA